MKTVRILLIFLFFCLSAAAIIFYLNFRGFGKNLPKERYIVKFNAADEQVIDDLYSKGFIRNKKIFFFVLDLLCRQRTCSESTESADRRIEPGAYMISKSQNAYQLSGVFLFGPFQKWVTIPPGKRKEQVGLILKKSLGWPDDMVLNFITIAKEGYLWPDTYLFNTDSDPSQIADRLKNEFNSRLDTLFSDLLAKNIKTDTAVKFASLIERESGSLEDKPVISAVIWNRLAKKMKLEIDATVQYAIADEEFNSLITNYQLLITDDFSFWPKLGAGVVRTIDSPYNTYRVAALPLGPICTPSLESLQAVLNPANTDALYYLHSSDKQIHTAKTYKEHQENIKEYLQ
ncbi:endolytic transglycosylase MltG [Candidatus Shapirobacteria bacterium CG03_land_8_20_14_0_80_40_19]|uniref:Endolytic murein transglycosylase n=1 Tax=Candidatus Shapirobacteria bacterium CG03_land_8_20_14_0_80_40_19 TaxID=1974880 RepID=A0A2M7BE17_9BACT|nr:MAG: endolytic transglycosylase MltG [Candidatus Shapirobacteria bacterium CG03_land_8_20_14_0_80_40_19]